MQENAKRGEEMACSGDMESNRQKEMACSGDMESNTLQCGKARHVNCRLYNRWADKATVGSHGTGAT